jgi:predicted TIM-barrel fold metal-dependent hydrolase
MTVAVRVSASVAACFHVNYPSLPSCARSDRLMFASNFPVDRTATTLKALYASFGDLAAAAGVTGGDLRAMMHDNAARVYRF